MSEEDLVPLSTNINPFNVQVGGDHYKDCAIQPTVYSHYNNLNTCEANIVKYITRHNKKGEGKEDILKVIHYAQLLLELEVLKNEKLVSLHNKL